MPSAERLVEVGVEAVAVAVDDALRQPLLDRPAGAVLLDTSAVVSTSANTLEQLLQRVVAGSTGRAGRR